jgi:glutathione-independent formaldehyde dehydrogenase
VKAVVYKGPRQVAVEEVAEPQIEHPTDVILHITSCAICGSDLHMYDGRTDAKPGLVLGHEPLGVVEEVGAAVTSIKTGDRVFVPTHITCGFCMNCVRGLNSACLTVNPGSFGGAYGYTGMGPYQGAQAEYLRVPFADANCLVLPGQPRDALENDFAMLPDAFVTGFHASELAGISPGDTVAIFGAGTIGLLSAYCAFLRGAGEVYIVDRVKARLDKAQSIGAIPIDFYAGDPVQQILDRRRQHAGPLLGSGTQMPGVMCGIDAVGFQAVDWNDPARENPTVVLEALAELINPTGRLGILGVYEGHDPGQTGPLATGHLSAPWGTFFRKGVHIGFGRTNDERYNRRLRDLIIAGRAHPGFVVTQRISFEDIPKTYAEFDRRENGVIKAILDPSL